MAVEPRLLYGPASSIVITGASSGIGEAIALHLADYGAKIALFARRRQRLEQVAARLNDAGAHALVLVGDVCDPAAVERAHAELVAAHGPVDVAFLNAGRGGSSPLARFDAVRLREIVDVNLFGVAHWLQHMLPSMLQRQRGTIVGMSSLAARRALPASGAYCASKGALSMLLESLRVEARPHNVQITTVEPGFVRSELTDRNAHHMPFMVERADAARRICEGAAAGKQVVRFPWQMATASRLLRSLPIPLYDRVAARMIPRKQRKRGE